MMLRGYSVSAVISVIAVGLCVSGCGGRGDDRGAATIDELVEHYRKAHEEQDMRAIRRIAWWHAHRHWPAGSHGAKDPPVRRVMEVPLADVQFLEGPPPDPEIGGEVRYNRDDGTVDSMIGPVYGKLILFLESGDKEPIAVDPAYIVMKSEGRFYLDVIPLVVVDAAESVETGADSHYTPHPLRRREEMPP